MLCKHIHILYVLFSIVCILEMRLQDIMQWKECKAWGDSQTVCKAASGLHCLDYPAAVGRAASHSRVGSSAACWHVVYWALLKYPAYMVSL